MSGTSPLPLRGDGAHVVSRGGLMGGSVGKGWDGSRRTRLGKNNWSSGFNRARLAGGPDNSVVHSSSRRRSDVAGRRQVRYPRGPVTLPLAGRRPGSAAKAAGAAGWRHRPHGGRAAWGRGLGGPGPVVDAAPLPRQVGRRGGDGPSMSDVTARSRRLVMARAGDHREDSGHSQEGQAAAFPVDQVAPRGRILRRGWQALPLDLPGGFATLPGNPPPGPGRLHGERLLCKAGRGGCCGVKSPGGKMGPD